MPDLIYSVVNQLLLTVRLNAHFILLEIIMKDLQIINSILLIMIKCKKG